VFKLSEYPITDISVEHENADVKERWETYFREHLRFRPFQIECGLDYHTYGNAMVSLGFPFHKYLKCQHCRLTERADKIRQYWTFTNLNFRLNCPKCGNVSEAEATDFYYRDANAINTIRWNCEHVEVTYNDVTGQSTYFYTIPPTVRNDVVIGKKDVVESVPQVFIQAMRERKGVVFSKDNFFHMKRPTLAQQDRGWGTPIILPVLKDTFYMQIMKKAQEAILLEHIVPLRVLFPQAGSGSSDPYTTVNLTDWRDHVGAEIARWRQDCVSPDTLVETPDGVAAAEAITEGDLLRDHLGGYSRVKKVWKRPLRAGEKAYSIRARGLGGVIPVVSEGHPFLAAKKLNNGNGHKLGEAGYIRAKDLSEGDYIGYPLRRERTPWDVLDLAQHTDRACTDSWCYVDHVDDAAPRAYEFLVECGPPEDRESLLKERGWTVNQYKAAQAAYREGRVLRRVPRYLSLTDDFLWVLGLYLAEGSVSRKQVLFAANKKEHELYERVYRFFDQVFDASGFTSDKGGNGCQHVFSSVVAAQVFSSLCAGTATTKRIHRRLLEASDSQVTSLLRGAFDGDGCAHNDGSSNKSSIGVASPQLACGIQRLLLSLGVPAGISYKPPHQYDICGKTGMSNGCHSVGVYGSSNTKMRALFEGREFHGVLQPTMGVERDGYFWFRISEIEESHTDEVIGFQMEDSEVSVRLDDGEAHGTFCLHGMASANSNYIPILPLPIGNQTIGGDGRALLLTQEIQTLSEHIMSGLGVPREFLLGGMSYSGSNVSLRMLENQFLGFILRHKQLANWTMKQVAAYMGWPEATIRFKPFKMADDIQRKAYLFQLNQAQKVSDRTLLADADLDQVKEDRIMMQETDLRLEATRKQQLALAEVQGEAQVVMSKAQVKAQQVMAQAQNSGVAPGEPGGGETGAPNPMQQMQSSLSLQQETAAAEGSNQEAMGVDIQQLAQQLAQQVAEIPPDQQQVALENLAAQSPDLAQMVQQILQQLQGPAGSQGALTQSVSQVDMRPQPEVLPARRVAAAI
jgi:hypothetical protein